MSPRFFCHVVKLLLMVFSIFTGSRAWLDRDKTQEEKTFVVYLYNGGVKAVSVLIVRNIPGTDRQQKMVFKIHPREMIAPSPDKTRELRCGICWETNATQISYHEITLVHPTFVAPQYVKAGVLDTTGRAVPESLMATHEYMLWQILNDGVYLQNFQEGRHDLIYPLDANAPHEERSSCNKFLTEEVVLS